MGLFGKKEICSICNGSEGSKKLQDGYICKNCMQKCVPFITAMSWNGISVERVRKALRASERNQQLQEKFCPTKKIGKYISFDENNQLWASGIFDIIFRYDEIISFELLEDGDVVSKGGLGNAVVGGMLFGGVGAIVGGVTGKKKSKMEVRELALKIVTRNEMCPQVFINFLTTGPIKSGSLVYNGYKASAQQIITQLTVIMDNLQRKEETRAYIGADEIMKYKKLYDEGILSQEEFEAKKKQILGL